MAFHPGGRPTPGMSLSQANRPVNSVGVAKFLRNNGRRGGPGRPAAADRRADRDEPTAERLLLF